MPLRSEENAPTEFHGTWTKHQIKLQCSIYSLSGLCGMILMEHQSSAGKEASWKVVLEVSSSFDIKEANGKFLKVLFYCNYVEFAIQYLLTCKSEIKDEIVLLFSSASGEVSRLSSIYFPSALAEDENFSQNYWEFNEAEKTINFDVTAEELRGKSFYLFCENVEIITVNWMLSRYVYEALLLFDY